MSLTVFTQRNFVADFLQAKCDFRGKTAVFEPPLGDLGATYDDHLMLIGKRVGDFLLVLIELFSLGRTAEALRVNIGSKSGISHQQSQLGCGQAGSRATFCSKLKTHFLNLSYNA